MGKSILVTGAGGFIGGHLGKALLEVGNEVRAVDIKWDKFIKIPYFSDDLTLDLRGYENCEAATKGIDYVFNCAANMGGTGFITKVRAEIMHDNALINTNMLKASLKNGVKRFFQASSACVYPETMQKNVKVRPLSEKDAYPAEPDTFYGWEKVFSEKLCEAYRQDYNMDIKVARYHNVYGPEGTYAGGREKAPAALARKVVLASNPGKITIWGDGKQTRSFCYIDDCVSATLKLMESNYTKPLNIGSDRLVTINQVADMLVKISGKKIKKVYDESKPQGVRGRNADLTEVKKVLGWKPQVPLEVGLEKTYRWIEGQYKRKR